MAAPRIPLQWVVLLAMMTTPTRGDAYEETPVPLISNSPYRRGSAEDFTYKVVEDAQERNTGNDGEASMAVSLGLAHVLRGVFKLPVLAFRLLKRLLASGTVVRWTVIAGMIASLLGLMLSVAMHDEIVRAQVRFVPVGLAVGLALGMVRRAMLRKTLPNS